MKYVIPEVRTNATDRGLILGSESACVRAARISRFGCWATYGYLTVSAWTFSISITLHNLWLRVNIFVAYSIKYCCYSKGGYSVVYNIIVILYLLPLMSYKIAVLNHRMYNGFERQWSKLTTTASTKSWTELLTIVVDSDGTDALTEARSRKRTATYEVNQPGLPF